MKTPRAKTVAKEIGKELLFSVTKKDFMVETFRAGGPGGQHQNKTDSAVRIRHLESGAVGESRSERSQHTNKKLAFKRLLQHPKWRVWMARKAHEALSGQTLEERVDELMSDENIRVEMVSESGSWVEIPHRPA